MNQIFVVFSLATIILALFVFSAPPKSDTADEPLHLGPQDDTDHRRPPALLDWFTSLSGAAKVFTVWALCALGLTTAAAVHYWTQIQSHTDDGFRIAGLSLTMFFGMFASILTRNRRRSKPLLASSAEEMLYPMVFSLVVFFPLWNTIQSSSSMLFEFYSAFLSGYSWESVVSSKTRRGR